MQSSATLSTTPQDQWLIVSIAEQSMAFVCKDKIREVFPISTSKNPPSCLQDSHGTPTGLHAIADKIGANEPEGMVFKGRHAMGKHYSEYTGDAARGNLITSRILRLVGLEKGKNAGPGCDSYARYIYIHGTNHEDRIGQPFSGGCVELRNADVIKLFDLVEIGAFVWIVQ